MAMNPFNTTPNGFFNPYIGGQMARRKEDEESANRNVERQSNIALIGERLQKMRDFEEARKSRLAKYGYDEKYYGAKTPLAGEEAQYDVSKKGLDNQRATFELRKKRDDLMREYMPAIMRMRERDPQGAARLYNRLFGENGLYGPGAGLAMGEAGAAMDPMADPKHMRDLDMERQRRQTAAAGRAGAQSNWRDQQQFKADNELVTVVNEKGMPQVMPWKQAQEFVKNNPGSSIPGKAGSFSPNAGPKQEYQSAKALAKQIQREVDKVIPDDQSKISKTNVASLKANMESWEQQAYNITDPNLREQVLAQLRRTKEMLPILEQAAEQNLTKRQMLELLLPKRQGATNQQRPQAPATSSNGFSVLKRD